MAPTGESPISVGRVEQADSELYIKTARSQHNIPVGNPEETGDANNN